MQKFQLSWEDIEHRADLVARQIDLDHKNAVEVRAYPIPRGGIPAALAIQCAVHRRQRPIVLLLVESMAEADIYLDDIVDTGATRDRYCNDNPKPFYALVDKLTDGPCWFVFPWERMVNEDGPEENVRRVIEYIGDDPKREGLRETPSRVVRSYSELFSGYGQSPADAIKVFEDGACDEMVILRDLEFYSCCEHHMLPFFGKAQIAYIPDRRVIGASKLARILEIYSRRLQIQERLCAQVTAALDEFLQPKGSACVLEAKHLCMVCRGVQKQNSILVTSSLTGVFRDSSNDARREFLGMIGHA